MAAGLPLGLAETSSPSIFSQRLAYGITPENEHHLVAQRDVRQFQVGGGRGVLRRGLRHGPSLLPAVCWPHTHPLQTPAAVGRASGVWCQEGGAVFCFHQLLPAPLLLGPGNQMPDLS